MNIIIGLGNPGEQYKNTRHNVGFMVLDSFAEKNNFPEFKLQKKSNSLITEKPFDTAQGDKNIILVKPQTFMNESGKAVQKILSNNKDQVANIIIVHDDIDLPIGKIKIVKDRGSAGHKGVESIIKSIGNENLIRIRIGIETKKNVQATDIVLKKFSLEEQKIISEIISMSADAIDYLLKEGLEKAMNKYN
jgi:PTH1 family peptidyl-tRNA hydrolase